MSSQQQQQQQQPTHSPSALLQALLSTIETRIVPLTARGVSSGSKVFGAAILSKADLTPLTVASNNESVSPLLHGEVNCIQEFFAQTSFPPPRSSSSSGEAGEDGGRPSPKSCFFLATHEPCSLCLSALAWSGFDEVFYLFAHEDSRDLFAIPYDIQILEEVFRVPPPSSSSSSQPGPAHEKTGSEVAPPPPPQPLYNRRNKFFTVRSLAELVGEIADLAERARWEYEMGRVRDLYAALSEQYQQGKRDGVGSASFWK
ncbi:cytidine deaminase-like protein [Biscogniauxia marginata]|nr:cytidine deaminase-like protein [Biscogniauxia marginata]